MNLFHLIVLILCVVFEFSSCNILLVTDQLVFENINTEKSIGDFCEDQSGTCKLISDCPEIVNLIKSGQKNHTVCGYEKLEQIVCCPLLDNMFELVYREQCTTPENKYIEIIGETCTEEISGKQGNYRWSKQCPFYSNHEIKSEYNCCTEVVCCPDHDIIPSAGYERKCIDYSRSLFEGKFEINGPYTPTRTGLCESFILGGNKALLGQFPFMAALGFQNGNGGFSYDCGGTLISEKYVLTAGHCLSSSELGPIVTVRLGAISLNENEYNGLYFKDYSVIGRIPHPNYKRRFHYNDIALLLLDRPVEFNRFIRPACLPNSIEMTNLVTAMGWGMTERGSKSENLLEVNVEIFSHTQCNESYSRNINRRLNLGIVNETQVCAGSWSSNRDTCQGDSGGPLVLKHAKLYAIHNVVGITSMGQFCGTAGTPGVYTRVFPYVEWIQSIVWPDTV